MVAEAGGQGDRFEESVAVDGPDARAEEALHCPVGMVGGVPTVRDVENGGDTGVEGFEGPGPGAELDVVGLVAR